MTAREFVINYSNTAKLIKSGEIYKITIDDSVVLANAKTPGKAWENAKENVVMLMCANAHEVILNY